MGFIEKLSKSFVLNEEPILVTPVERRSNGGSIRIPPPNLEGTITVGVRGTTQLDEGQPPPTSASISVSDQRETVKTCVTQVVSEPSTSVTFGDADLDHDLDDAFATLVVQDVVPKASTLHGETIPDDREIVETLFAEIAANYARPVKNFIFELKRGTAAKEWVEICRPAMRGITRAAEGMGLSLAAQRMLDFEAALSLAQTSEQRVLSGDKRDLLLWCYEDLVKAMPQAFFVGAEEQQREGIIINSLLRQIPEVGLVTIERLYRAGLTSLDALFLAKTDELAATAGIPFWLSERICEKFQAYRMELAGDSRDLAESAQRARIGAVLFDLRYQHELFQHASRNESSNPSLSSRKREARQQRQSCMLRINILLAEVGELDLINELQKLSFERRIQRLKEYLTRPTI